MTAELMFFWDKLDCLIIFVLFCFCVGINLKDMNFGIHSSTSYKSSFDWIHCTCSHQTIWNFLFFCYQETFVLIPNLERTRIINSTKIILSLFIETIFYTIYWNSFINAIYYSGLLFKRLIFFLFWSFRI